MADSPFLPEHCRAARALLGMTQEEIAREAEVGRMTVKRFEASEGVRPAQAAMIRIALERRGCRFLTNASVGDDVRLTVGVGIVAQR